MESNEKTVDDVRMSGEATENQLVVAANEYLHPLQPYGPTKALREMTRRIMTLDTAQGDSRFRAIEAAHLAQVAASSQLNPFTGEIWGWVAIKSGVRHLTVMPGRRGLLRHAHEQAKDQGTHFWPEYDQMKDADERADYMLPDGALAFGCRLKEHSAIETWTMAINACRDAGYTPEEIRKEVGPMPFTFGLGVLTKQEMATLDKNSRNKMSHVERCQKRAYMMALKQRFDLPLGGSVGTSGETIDDYIPDAEWREVDESDSALVPDAEDEIIDGVINDPTNNGDADPTLQDRAKEGADTLFEPQAHTSVSRDWSDEMVKAMRASEHFPGNAATKRIVATLNLSPFNDSDPGEWIIEWMGEYKKVRESIEDTAQAASISTRKWAVAHKNDKNAHARFGQKVIENWAK